jgi:hypothetical protein
MPDQLRVRITATDRADEWSPDNPALLMPTQSGVDTPGAPRFRIASTDRTEEWSPDNPALLMPTQSSVPDTPEATLERNA